MIQDDRDCDSHREPRAIINKFATGVRQSNVSGCMRSRHIASELIGQLDIAHSVFST